VNKQREIEMDRFLGNARTIQKQYDNIIPEYAKKKGICGYLTEKDCTKGKDCYWFSPERDVVWKDVGCYSKNEPRKNWGKMEPTKRSKKTHLPILGEEERRITIPMVTAAKARLSRVPEQQSMSENLEEKKEGGRTRKKRRKRGGKSRRRKVPLSIIFGTKLSKSTKLKKWRAMKKHQKTKKRKKTRRKRKRRTKRRKR
jgi:hypothetical protein